MNALLLFHLRAGVRLGLRASAAIFAAIVAWIIFQDSAQIVTFVNDLARSAFAPRPAIVDVAPILCLAFLLPTWAVGRLSRGLNGWLRHLPVSGAENRRGLTLALVSVQLPLLVMLAFGALLAHAQGAAVAVPAARWILVLIAGATASLPVERRQIVIPLAISAAASAFLGAHWYMGISPALLMASDAVAGPIRATPMRSPWRTAGTLLHWRIAWRALGGHVFVAGGLGLMAIGFGWLFVRNNGLVGVSAQSPLRFTGGIASALCIFSLTKALALRRPAWSLARSFPWSATQRVGEDGIFLGAHALPLLLLVAFQDGTVALTNVALLPFLSFRAAGYMRRIPDEHSCALVFLAEGLLAASVLTLLPWTAFVWLVASPPALLFSAERERRHKVTRWSDWQYANPGDTSLRIE
jgi:hypothetical protein